MHFIRRHSTTIIHIVIWISLIHLIFNWNGILDSLDGLIHGEFIDEALIIIPAAIILFYVNSQYLIPKFLNGNSWWIYVIAIVALAILLMTLSASLYQIALNSSIETNLNHIEEFIDYSLIFYLITIGISTATGFSNIAAKKEMQKREAIDKQKIAELKFLTTQVSPHFLFNSLNSIYALAQEEDADLTSDAILKLSHMMRYPFSDGMKERVSISQEIEFLENYLALQKTKLGEDYPIEFNSKISDSSFQVAPLLMIPIIENAFKYGVSRSQPEAISIDIHADASEMKLIVQNSITQNKGVISHQVGLDNLRERLEILYPGKHSFSTSSKESIFRAELILHK